MRDSPHRRWSFGTGTTRPLSLNFLLRSRGRPPQVRTRCVRAQAPHLPCRSYRWASLSCASSPRPAQPSMRFLSVASHVCSPASFRQSLTSLPLPSASGYSCRMRQDRYSHRGLTPHYIAPMLGAHPSVNRTACKLRLQVRSGLRPPPAGYVERYASQRD